MENQKWSSYSKVSDMYDFWLITEQFNALCVCALHKISMETLEGIHANNMIMNCIYIVTLVTKAK